MENRPKLAKLEAYYEAIGQNPRFLNIMNIVRTNETLAEVNAALVVRNQRGEINNRGVLSMLDQYFTELTFIFAEIYRVCQAGPCGWRSSTITSATLGRLSR